MVRLSIARQKLDEANVNPQNSVGLLKRKKKLVPSLTSDHPDLSNIYMVVNQYSIYPI